MRRKTDLPELLAPAGNMDALYAAVMAGADAVYVGGKSFGARAYAENFDLSELKSAVEYCHLHGVKLYVTVNTLVFDKELPALSDYAIELWKIGVDALICADLGAIKEIRRRVPLFEIHASTQMSVHNADGAVMAAQLGVSRVVPARELSLADIKYMVENSPIEVEVFLHGALCVCHSGQCLMSSMIGGRSGNRGECAQPCRLPYGKGDYALSLKDLSLAGHIDELLESGVASLKIEGRMKSAQYVYNVTKIYRRLLDERRNATEKETEHLRRVFSRDGFTDGYFIGKTERAMTGVRSDVDKGATENIAATDFAPIRKAVKARVRLALGQRSEMTLILGDKEVTACGPEPTVAQNAPLTDDGVRARLSKMGNTFFVLDKDDIDLSLEEGVNLAPSALNALRRDAVEMLVSSKREVGECAAPCEIKHNRERQKSFCTATFFNPAEYEKFALRNRELSELISVAFLPLHRIDEVEKMSNGVYIPPVVFDSEMAEIEALLDTAAERGAEYALVSGIGAIALAKRHGLIPIGDFRLNVTNSLAREQYAELGVSHIILSPELTVPMARDIGGSVITLGRIPLMLTERCFIKERVGCDGCAKGDFALTDRKGAAFPMLREFRHRNIIFNSTITYMGDRGDELYSAGLRSAHLIFSVERAEKIAELLKKYRSASPLNEPVRRIGKR